jgi:hypothetical protein
MVAPREEHMLKIERIITFGLVLAVSVFAIVNWRKARLFEEANEQLTARLNAADSEADSAGAAGAATAEEIAELRKRSAELMRLRNEITQIRANAQNTEKLAAENQRLKADLAKARGNLGAAEAQTAAAPQGGGDQYPREGWRMAGYHTPEDALVTAIWSMKEGDPQQYYNSLAPAEQQRTAQNWQTMSQDQLMAKHRNDVANISGMRILQREVLAPDEMVMNVFLEGPGRMERVRLNQVGQEWKFSGFVRDQPQQPAAPAALQSRYGIEPQ